MGEPGYAGSQGPVGVPGDSTHRVLHHVRVREHRRFHITFSTIGRSHDVIPRHPSLPVFLGARGDHVYRVDRLDPTSPRKRVCTRGNQGSVGISGSMDYVSDLACSTTDRRRRKAHNRVHDSGGVMPAGSGNGTWKTDADADGSGDPGERTRVECDRVCPARAHARGSH